jgi:peptidoglycan/LPS O-acetylase OafA/YrhL
MKPEIKNNRIYYLDWLKVIAMGGVFLLHCACIFAPPDWHIKNSSSSIPLFLVVILNNF